MDVTIGKIAVLYAVITLVLVAINILVGVFYSRGYTWARITAAVLAILGAMNNLLLAADPHWRVRAFCGAFAGVRFGRPRVH